MLDEPQSDERSVRGAPPYEYQNIKPWKPTNDQKRCAALGSEFTVKKVRPQSERLRPWSAGGWMYRWGRYGKHLNSRTNSGTVVPKHTVLRDTIPIVVARPPAGESRLPWHTPRVLAGHAPGTSACATTGGRSYAHPIYSVHARSTRLSDLDDRIIRHLKRCKRHGLNRRYQHQSHRQNNPSGHCISPY